MGQGWPKDSSLCTTHATAVNVTIHCIATRQQGNTFTNIYSITLFLGEAATHLPANAQDHPDNHAQRNEAATHANQRDGQCG